MPFLTKSLSRKVVLVGQPMFLVLVTPKTRIPALQILATMEVLQEMARQKARSLRLAVVLVTQAV